LSQEQANNIAVKEKLSIADTERTAEKERVVQISEENNNKENKLKEEIEKLRTESEEYKTLLIQREQEFYQQAEKEIENVTKEEQEKANDRLNIILFELNKVNTVAAQLKDELEIKDTELNKVVEENSNMRYTLEKREQEMALIRDEKLELAAKHEQRVKQVDQLEKDFDAKVEYSDTTRQELDNAHILIRKLKTQLDEREKTLASFREQGTNLAEILERNNLAGDSLQREREELVNKVQEQVVEVQEMKKHREILAKKLKTKVLGLELLILSLRTMFVLYMACKGIVAHATIGPKA
jgi:structural maintenance of chromosome 1